MRHVDLPAFPSFTGAMGASAVAIQPSVAASGSAVAFTPLGQEVAHDVQQFIAQGGSSMAHAAAVSSAQANWLAVQAARQLRQSTTASASAAPAYATGGTTSRRRSVSESESTGAAAGLKPEQHAFLERIGPWAQQAAQQLGVSVRSVLAHAALESGWGQRPVRTPDGRDTLNLFGIKAMGGWSGESTQAVTHEFEDGEAVRQVQSFRQYAGLDDTFADYVNLLAHNPRYRAALNTGEDVRAFASALAAGGYATDPEYANKLERVSRSIRARP